MDEYPETTRGLICRGEEWLLHAGVTCVFDESFFARFARCFFLLLLAPLNSPRRSLVPRSLSQAVQLRFLALGN